MTSLMLRLSSPYNYGSPGFTIFVSFTMPASLTPEETSQRFGVSKAIDNFPSRLTAQEEANVKVVLEYMEVCVSTRT